MKEIQTVPYYPVTKTPRIYTSTNSRAVKVLLCNIIGTGACQYQGNKLYNKLI